MVRSEEGRQLCKQIRELTSTGDTVKREESREDGATALREHLGRPSGKGKSLSALASEPLF